MDSEKIGKFIAELRKENKMTQEELGKKILVDRGTISKWERGIYVPNPEILLSLSKILSVSVNEILLGEKETSKNKVELNNVTVQILDKNRN